MHMLIAEGIEKSYRSQKVLQGVDLSVAKGEFVSIMGESGSGKSTLLSILAGNMKPDAGRVLLEGEPIDAHNESALARLRRESIGFVYPIDKKQYIITSVPRNPKRRAKYGVDHSKEIAKAVATVRTAL
jgi:predicted ABC-type transport system involved in lysophospholipase L1 biosynthesis ATPase subunit